MTDPLVSALAVGVGGALGAVSRHLVGLVTESRRSLVVVNTTGSFVLGLLVAAPPDALAVVAIGVGFCGAFTTFSSFAVETVTTAATGDHGVAATFAALNVGAAVMAFLVGSGLALTTT
ncbi:MAG: CrcB family protein [Halorubrum sp.]